MTRLFILYYVWSVVEVARFCSSKSFNGGGGGGGGGGGVSGPSMSACLIESKKDWTGQDRTGHRRTYTDVDGHWWT